MRAQVIDRWRPALALALPVLGGLAYLAAFGAPARLIAANAGALVLALSWTMWGRLPKRAEARIGLAAVAAGTLFLPLLTGPEVGGAARWLRLGPVQLHASALLLPVIVVLAARALRVGPVLLAIAGAALSLQPDAQALAALAAASAALAWIHRSAGFALVAAASLALAIATFGAGPQAPQLYTEGVLPHVAGRSLAGALALGVLLFVASPMLLLRGSGPEGMSLAALLAGFAVLALIGPFPFPLIGYGAAPILGFGLASGALARLPQRHPSG